MLIGCIALLVLACLSATPLSNRLGAAAGWPLAALFAGSGILLAATAATTTRPAALEMPWFPTLGVDLALRLDGLSLLFGLLVSVIGVLVMAYSARYLGRGAHAGFFVLMSVFALAMMLLVVADDVVVFFVAWEATTLASFFLIARSGAHARAAAVRTLLVTVLGGLALLAAVLTMSLNTGTTRLSTILGASFWHDGSSAGAVVGALLAVAAFTKAAQFPFQSWLPDSMVAATPVSAYLHAAAMVKAGIYLLLRFTPVLAGDELWTALLVTAGAITALIGANGALRQHDLKALLAYSTVSQLGFLVLTIGVGTAAAVQAAIVHTLAHAVFKAALFMVVGIIDRRAGTRDIRELRSVRLRMPALKAVAVVAALSMAGAPPLLGFVSKEGIFDALLDAAGGDALALVALLAAIATAVLTVAYAGRFALGVLGGRTGRSVGEAAWPFLLPPAVLAVVGMGLGIAPGVLDSLVQDAASQAAGQKVSTHLLLWHGLNWPLAISAGVLAIGTVLVLTGRRVEVVATRLKMRVAGTGVVEAARSGIIRFGGIVTRASGSLVPARHLAIPIACLVLIAAATVPFLGELPPSVGEASHPLDWILVALVVIGTLATVAAGTRLAAVVVAGVIGLTMTLWYFWLGAADVAFTQLLVEILTVVVIVLILRRLPRRFRRDSRRRRWSSGALAIAAGAATVAGVLIFTGRRELSAASDYFLRNAEADTGGTNIVNTILVDYRALDTLGELTVLGVAGVAVAALLSARPSTPDRPATTAPRASLIADEAVNAVFTRTAFRWLGPLSAVIAAVLLLRGHYEPGGGFIGALVAASGLALWKLSAPQSDPGRARWAAGALIGSGIAVATAVGLAGFAAGSFLRPMHVDILGVSLTTALLFDVGVFLAVIGVILAALKQLSPRSPAPAHSSLTISERNQS